jgi:hypothetical protein
VTRGDVGRYIKRHRRIGSIGPNEERGFGLWAGYQIDGVDADLSAHGLINVDHWPEDRIAEHGVAVFMRVEAGDEETLRKLGIPKE